MAVQQSAGVIFNEIDLTTIVPQVSTSVGALAGVFGWGPVGETVLVGSEPLLVQNFGQPTNLNPETWFTGANFLSYADALMVSRAANTTGATPVISVSSTANSTVSNNIFVLTSGNTNSLVAGMYVAQSGNSSVVAPGNSVSIAVINSIAISLSTNTNSNTTVALYLANPGTTYNALALAPNAVVANLVNQVVINPQHYYTISANNFDSNVLYAAKYPGGIGNSLRISVCDTASAFSSNVALSGYANTVAISNATSNVTSGHAYSGVFATTIGSNTASLVFTPSANGGSVTETNTVATYAYNSFSIGDNIVVGNSSIGWQYLYVTSVSNVVTNSTASAINFTFQQPYRLHTPYSNTTNVQRYWEFYNTVGTAPGQSYYVQVNGNTAAQDEMHIVVVDDNGQFTGTPGTVLETYKGLSRATDAENLDGTENYYVNVLNQNSAYVWWANDRSGAASANSWLISSSTNLEPGDYTFTLGTDGYSESTAPLSILGQAYNFFALKENITVDLIMQGYPAGGSGQTYQLANYLIDNIVTQRRDCVAFISPDKSLVLNNFGMEAQSIGAWVYNNIHTTSYAVCDTGYKYQYDKYNNLYRWIPLNGDVAGLCARTDQTNDAWWSPAGFNRGQINNLVKLAYNPNQTDRDYLYPHNVNPVVTFPGQGTVLYGDKTLQFKPSAFDRINVRRLFIVLERAISKAAEYSLFEFNDTFTRAQFVNLVNPYLRNIQGRRGITDFLVVCDNTNNTPAVIDSNQFIGDIYIKPARSINFIQLNFVAVPTGVQFSSVVGSFD